MQVKLIQTFATAEVAAGPGDVITVATKLGKALVASGDAVEFEQPRPTKKKKVAAKPSKRSSPRK